MKRRIRATVKDLRTLLKAAWIIVLLILKAWGHHG